MEYQTAVRSRDTDDGKVYDAYCACATLPVGSGNPPWSSTGWTQKKNAASRLAEHTAEHESGEPMRELHDFREERGLNGPVLDTIPLPTSDSADGGEG